MSKSLQYKVDILKQILAKGIYTVDCNKGIVYGKFNQPLGSRNNKGYLTTTFRHKGKRYTFSIHCIIAYYGGLDVSEDLTINHIDGNKTNNSITNLETITRKENVLHGMKLGLIPKVRSLCGADNPGAKLTNKQVMQIRTEYAQGTTTVRELGHKYNISHPRIVRIINHKAYTNAI